MIEKKLSVKNFLGNGFFPAPVTMLYRNDVWDEKLPCIILECLNEDRVLFSILSKQGDAAYLDEKTAAYRKHGKSINSSNKYAFKLRAVVETYKKLSIYFMDRSEKKMINQSLWGYYYKLAILSITGESNESLRKVSFEIFMLKPIWIFVLIYKISKYKIRKTLIRKIHQ